ncbi:MAG: tetratricopeptide repeat protein [Chitinophagaceae bacterium]|nr:tetratricopeptide repeat protein [Oligoflexus sp.]
MNARLLSWMICAVAFCFLSLSIPASIVKAQDRDLEALKPAQEEFTKQRYSTALTLLRSYLRDHPNDQDAWVWLGASYYHTGQAQLALTTLLKAKPKSDLKSLRRYYLALSYDALGKSEKAKTLLAAQARSKDLVAEDALFELTVIQYEEGDMTGTQKNIEDYNKRFPDGRHEKQIMGLKDHLTEAGHSDVPGSRRAQYKATFFETNPMSIVSIPHLWFYEVGYDYARGARSNPGYNGQTPTVQTNAAFEEYKLVTQAGLILGPFKGTGTQSHVGYIYSQNWFSDSDRMQTYTNDPGDFQYFPFRPDLMERTHRLFVETQGTRGNWNFGGYGSWSYIRAGSDLFPAPERPEIRKSFDLGIVTVFVPWVEWLYTPQSKFRLYLTFEKHLNREQDSYSYKTYNIASTSESPFMSFTLQHETRFTILDAQLKEEVFQHQYLYNDYWESYRSIGASASLQFRLWNNLHLAIAGSMATKNFDASVIRAVACSDIGVSVDQSTTAAVTCPRQDQITKFAAGASYVTNSQQSFAGIFRYNDQKNDKLIVYNENKVEILFVFTQAFPTLLGVERYIEPFIGLADQRGVF